MKIVVTDFIELEENHLIELKNQGDVVFYDTIPGSIEETISRTEDAVVAITNWCDMPEEVIAKSRKLEAIIVSAKGVDGIDIIAAKKREIKVLNCPSYSTNAVAEHTLFLILGVTNRIKEANLSLRNGEWEQNRFRGEEVQNKKLGIIGSENVGKRLETIANGVGMKVTALNSKAASEEIDELLSTSDIITVHLNLTPENKNFLNQRRFKLIKRGAYVIIKSPSGLIDQSALLEQLTAGHLAGAGLDVFADEQIGRAPTAQTQILINHPKVLATPHIAYNKLQAIHKLGEEILANIKSCLEGKPINVVNW